MAREIYSKAPKDAPQSTFPDEVDGTDMQDDELAPGEIQARRSFGIEIFEFLEMLILASCAIMLFFTFVARICTVDGPSMNNTLEDGDKLIVSDIFYTPSQGDIVVFQDLDIVDEGTGKPRYENAIIKRVIATEGQIVELQYKAQGDITTVTVLVDGNVLDEPYRYYDPSPTAWKDRYTGTEIYKVPEGCLFVMGDNTYHSEDSRGVFEYVDENNVLGRVVFRLGGKDLSTLFSKIGFVQ